ncbi:unnamed protein product [Musa textilis]
MSSSIAAIVGAAAGALALLVIIIGFLWFYILCCRTPANKSSETGSSDPSNPGNRTRYICCIKYLRSLIAYIGYQCAGCGLASEHQGARQFTLEELEEATKNFSESNIVGTGSFGLVYKGLLLDGTIVAIKRRVSVPRQAFTEQVNHFSQVFYLQDSLLKPRIFLCLISCALCFYQDHWIYQVVWPPSRSDNGGMVRILSEIRHRNLVTLIGYCQEGGLQMLIFEYLPNGSISGHLYDSEQHSLTRLEFKQRLAVAIGAAKGLAHLHGLSPPVVHKDFKTSNVLVDENFIAKVADAGVFKLLQGTGEVRPQGSSNIFQDPGVGELQGFSEASDVYSFGVFLLELISGIEVTHCICQDSYSFLVQWVEAHMGSNDLIDRRLGGGFTSEGMKELIALTLQCLNPSGHSRPKMRAVVVELDRILEMEMALTMVMGDGTAIVILGSQLFTSA